MNNIENVAL